MRLRSVRRAVHLNEDRRKNLFFTLSAKSLQNSHRGGAAMSVHEDLGFVPSRPAPKRATPKRHAWQLAARTFGVERFRCERCRIIKTVNHADHITRYARGHTISALAPPCEAQQ